MPFKSLYHVLHNSVGLFRNRPLFHISPTSYQTYDAFMSNVNMYQIFLKERGVKPGDNIMIVGDNSPNWAAVLYASWGTGATIVPTFKNQQPHITQHIIKETEPKIIFNTGPNSLRGENEFNHEKIYSTCPSFPSDVDLNEDDVAAILYTSGTSGLPKGVPLTHKNIISNQSPPKQSQNH